MSKDDKTYNGWSTYETWAVALWLDNERSSYDYWREQAREQRRKASASDEVRDGVWSPEMRPGSIFPTSSGMRWPRACR